MTADSRLRTLGCGAALLVATFVLAGCSGGGGGGTVGTTPKAEDFFGTQFGVDFRATANSEPVTPADGDIIALSLTTEPQLLK